MSEYEAAPGVTPVRIVTYRQRSRAARRGWVLQSDLEVAVEQPSMWDVAPQNRGADT